MQSNYPSELNKAWLAGFVDGEGNIGFSRVGNGKSESVYYGSRMVVSNTRIESLKLIQSWYGGSVSLHKKQVNNHKAQYRWVISNKKLIKKVLLDILPYLILKNPQALVMLQYIDENNYEHGIGRVRQLTKDSIKKRNKFVSELYFLNKRGVAYEQ